MAQNIGKYEKNVLDRLDVVLDECLENGVVFEGGEVVPPIEGYDNPILTPDLKALIRNTIKTLSVSVIASKPQSQVLVPQNGWQAPGGASLHCSIGGVVTLSGNLVSGTLGQTALTIPEGYRPATDKTFLVYSLGVSTYVGVVAVGANGALVPDVGSVINGIELSNICYQIP